MNNLGITSFKALRQNVSVGCPDERFGDFLGKIIDGYLSAGNHKVISSAYINTSLYVKQASGGTKQFLLTRASLLLFSAATPAGSSKTVIDFIISDLLLNRNDVYGLFIGYNTGVSALPFIEPKLPSLMTYYVDYGDLGTNITNDSTSMNANINGFLPFHAVKLQSTFGNNSFLTVPMRGLLLGLEVNH